MELKEAIERLKNTDIYNLGHDDRFEELGLYENAIDTVLDELNNRIPRKDIEKEFDYFTSHNNNFNIADMELLKNKILDEI